MATFSRETPDKKGLRPYFYLFRYMVYNQKNRARFTGQGTQERFLAEFNYDANQRIVEIRKVLGLTQEKFASDVKISKAYQGHIEAKQRRVNDRIIKIISLTYGASEEWLKNGTGDMFERFDDPKIGQIVTNFKKLAPDAQTYLLKQIDLLLDYEAGRKT
jgi:transcriptional regulator with XRE-family HTH domain